MDTVSASAEAGVSGGARQCVHGEGLLCVCIEVLGLGWDLHQEERFAGGKGR